VGLQRNEDDMIFARKRVSYVVKVGKIVKNKRVYKTCPICSKDQKQIPKHVNTVHANMSKDIRWTLSNYVNNAFFSVYFSWRKIKGNSFNWVSLCRMKAILLCGTYRRKSQPAAATQCHICQEMRSNMSGHLLRKHKISKKSPEVRT